uniref:Uncharacterized protein LOC104266023 n=1 Tax=Phallusia mammillata TaxID=59560 RepID=A0A6F9DIE1_9ASCI|nr:uncharacterized protein LOC104266023 [Phallusia mammillata]
MICLKITQRSLNFGSFLVANSFRCVSTSPALLGVPKNQKSSEVKRKTRHNVGVYHRLLKSMHMLVICDGCGNLHKKYHMCNTCYDQTRFETQAVRAVLNEKGADLSSQTVLQYKDDIKEHLRLGKGDKSQVVNIEDRKRPAGWFNPRMWNKL